MNNRGDVVGDVQQSVQRDVVFKPGFFWDRAAKTLRELPPLVERGHTATSPRGLSDDGRLIAGTSQISAVPSPPSRDAKPVLWIDNGVGTFTVLDIEPLLLTHVASSPELASWELTAFEFMILPEGAQDNCLSPDGEFLLLRSTSAVWTGNPLTVGVVVRIDWSSPVSPQIAAMWVLGTLPDEVGTGGGYRVTGYALTPGVRDAGTAQERPVVRVSGSANLYSLDGSFLGGGAGIWELDPASGVTSISMLRHDVLVSESNSRGTAYDINAFGEAVGPASARTADSSEGYYWDPTGTPTRIPSLPGSTIRILPLSINNAGTVVGMTNTSNGSLVPVRWSAVSPLTPPQNLNTLTAGSWDLDHALEVNEAGDILAVNWGRSDLFYLLSPITPP